MTESGQEKILVCFVFQLGNAPAPVGGALLYRGIRHTHQYRSQRSGQYDRQRNQAASDERSARGIGERGGDAQRGPSTESAGVKQQKTDGGVGSYRGERINQIKRGDARDVSQYGVQCQGDLHQKEYHR